MTPESELNWMKKRATATPKILPDIDEEYIVDWSQQYREKTCENICEFCGNSFMSFTKRKYCSPKCIGNSIREQNRKAREEEMEDRKQIYSIPSEITTCDILKEHHENMKEDPEHLSCDFLKKIIGVDCKK